VLMDLADIGGNVRDGVHVASIGGTWMAVVYALARMRDYNGVISFHPSTLVESLCFRLMIRGQQLEVNIHDEQVTYTLIDGDGLSIRHRNEELQLAPGTAVTRALRAATSPIAASQSQEVSAS